jgi:hypothetical protein
MHSRALKEERLHRLAREVVKAAASVLREVSRRLCGS